MNTFIIPNSKQEDLMYNLEFEHLIGKRRIDPLKIKVKSKK